MPSGVQLRRDLARTNLAPCIRTSAVEYFGPPRKISWHTHANHALSSQVACLNFLMPLATRPALLSEVIGRALGISPPKMLEVEKGAQDAPWFVGFEWTGRQDHLGEWRNGSVTRGANATSADAIVRFQNEAGATEALLIEWKYTERYGTRPLDERGNPTRLARYSKKAFAPDGPIKNDLGLSVKDFFYEPFYQLLRQQMLAWRMERATEGGATRVRVLHIAPSANTDLHRVTAPALQSFGADALAVFRQLLVRPDDFLQRTTEELFGTLTPDIASDAETKDWASYLQRRYTFLNEPAG
ncbi:hypothetical protein [Afifella sp. IM 167]|uniref:PGN_0703 family putative restriction endonuclease n=1 Tax=Afifella sp. IM 167 TaxID=2033586 RepID=UPI001CD020E0|nr:hypothetical protein [Afifella sp. IM 167]